MKKNSYFFIAGDSGGFGDAKKDSGPFFKTFATLAIPNIVMQPALDEVQQTVNKAAQMIISVSKGVAKWSEERKRPQKSAVDREHAVAADRRQSVVSAASDAAGEKKEEETEMKNYTITQQAKNYFKAVSENKEVTKLVSLLSTSINSTKKVRNRSLFPFLNILRISCHWCIFLNAIKEVEEHCLLVIFYSLKWKVIDKRCLVTGI